MARRSDTGLDPTVRRDVRRDNGARAAYNRLMRDVFDLDPEAEDNLFGVDPTRRAFALFTLDGACVAGAETFTLPLVVDGAPLDAQAIRNVATAPAWRGRGLFRAVMTDLLAWCDAQPKAPQLLYTAEPALYERFGFRAIAQHTFRGPAPVGPAPPRAASGMRRLTLADVDDLALACRLLSARTPVSRHIALTGSPALVFVHLLDDPSLRLDYLDACDALVVSRCDAGEPWQLVDVIAAAIPSLAEIVEALAITPDEPVAVLFPPDRLSWAGTACDDDTGLMARGPCPAAFATPFMLPPTAEF